MIRLVCCRWCLFVVALENDEKTWSSCPRCAACKALGQPQREMPMTILQLPEGFEVTKK